MLYLIIFRKARSEHIKHQRENQGQVVGKEGKALAGDCYIQSLKLT